MAKRSTTVGLDVHKETIDVVVAEDGAQGEVRHFGTIGGDLRAVDRMVKQLRAAGRTLRFVYEAGPCGFHLYRHPAGPGLRVHGGVAVDDAEAKRGSDQDRPARRGGSGASSPRRGIASDLDQSSLERGAADKSDSMIQRDTHSQ